MKSNQVFKALVKNPYNLYVLMNESSIVCGIFCDPRYAELYMNWLKQRPKFKDSIFNISRIKSLDEDKGVFFNPKYAELYEEWLKSNDLENGSKEEG